MTTALAYSRWLSSLRNMLSLALVNTVRYALPVEITAVQFRRIEPFSPVQRGNVSLSNVDVVNAIL